MAFSLPALPYDYTALSPHIDETTMQIHHTKHHQVCIPLWLMFPRQINECSMVDYD